ncbi:tetratricopeptide repeat protein [Mucilaginibacter lutimaris]|uniref:Tetratricopeptide repeat protein n=1 Tax=Mucilaginibacter lutimaris TaxID=931629 RepID=A0ABW2ZAN7_9SPHI
MLSLKDLLNEVIALMHRKEYLEITNFLTDALLKKFNSPDLYAEKALAFWRLKKYDLCFEMAEFALEIDPQNSKAISLKGGCYWQEKKYDKAIEMYNRAISYDPYSFFSYSGLGSIYFDLKDYNNSILYHQKSIEINPESPYSWHGLGNAYAKLREYSKAVEFYNKALKIDPSFSTSYNSLGNLYRQAKDYKKAIDSYKKAISLDGSAAYAYNGLGNTYSDLKDYKNALKFYNKSLKIDSKYKAAYFNRAKLYEKIEEYDKAILNYQKRIELSQGERDYFGSLAKNKLIDLTKVLKSPGYSVVNELVDSIKKLLLYKEVCVTHYTGFSVTKALILNKSKFRLSEGTYLNDTSEGRELFNFLPSFNTKVFKYGDTVAQPFAIKPFIGSFVSESKHDDLTLWRMYGKEDKVEARGCAITIDRIGFLESVRELLNVDNNNAEKIDEEFSFFKVAYRRKGTKDHFTIPGAPKKDEASLNKLMVELLKTVKGFLDENDNKDLKDIISLLNGIAFLFKSAEYEYEHELRLIVKGTGLNKIINNEFVPPRVYLELVEVNPLIKKITFGPKVEKADEWASAFYYTLDQEGFNPDVFISHLPFK